MEEKTLKVAEITNNFPLFVSRRSRKERNRYFGVGDAPNLFPWQNTQP